MIEVSLSLIERDVKTLSPKIRLHRDMRRTGKTVHFISVRVRNGSVTLTSRLR